jgi:rRNA maturation RNase YbeY
MKNVSVFSGIPSTISRSDVHSAIGFLKKQLGFQIYSLEISFLSSDQLLQINREHLKHDYRTDIITFSYSEDPKYLDGELLISYEDAMQSAEKYHIAYKEELLRLVVHGILHILGYSDHRNEDRIKMELIQESLVEDIVLHLQQRKNK